MHEPDITMKCPLLKVYGPNFCRPSLMGCRFWDQRYAHPIRRKKRKLTHKRHLGIRQK